VEHWNDVESGFQHSAIPVFQHSNFEKGTEK